MAYVNLLKKTQHISKHKTDEVVEGAFYLLENYGISVLNEDMHNKLLKKGYKEKNKRIIFDKKLLVDFLNEFKNDKSIQDEILEKKYRTKLTGVPGSYTLKWQSTKTYRCEEYTRETLVTATKFMTAASQHFGNFQSFAPGCPSNVPPELESLYKYLISAKYGNGQVPIEPTSIVSAEYMFEMAQAMKQPIKTLPVYTVSPLAMGGDSLDIVCKYKNKLDAFYVFSMPTIGCTCPMSIIETLTICFAEVFGCALLVHELTGLKARIKPNVFPFDLQTMNYGFGTTQKFNYEQLVEDFLAQVLGTDINYHSTNIHTCCCESGVQSNIEKMQLITAGALAGATKFYCIGTLSLDEIFSPRELVLNAHIITRAQQLLDEVKLENLDKTILVNKMEQASASGFVMSDDTLDNHEDYIEYSVLENRMNFATSQSGNLKQMIENADELVHKLSQKEIDVQCRPLVGNELDNLYNKAEQIVCK